MKLSIAHLCIFTTDLEATRKFYCEALGCRKVFDFIHNKSLYGYYLEISDGNFIEVFLHDQPVGHQLGAIRHLCLETDDIHAAEHELHQNGVKTSQIKRGCDNTFQLWFRDPNGIDIELHQYTPESSQRTGKNCVVDWLEPNQ